MQIPESTPKITLGSNGKNGTSYETKTDADGDSYLEWIKGDSSIMTKIDENTNLSNINDTSRTVSYYIDFSKLKDKSLINVRLIILAASADGGEDFVLFRIKDDGIAYLNNNSNYPIGAVTELELKYELPLISRRKP